MFIDSCPQRTQTLNQRLSVNNPNSYQTLFPWLPTHVIHLNERFNKSTKIHHARTLQYFKKVYMPYVSTPSLYLPARRCCYSPWHLGWFIIGIFNPYLIQFYHTPASLITNKQVILIVFKINKFEIREPYVIQVSNSI